MTDTAISGATVPQLNRHFRMQWEPAQNCHVLLYPEGMVKLNDSAGLILSTVDGQRSIDDIVRELEVKFPDAEGIGADVLAFMQTALEQRWVELV